MLDLELDFKIFFSSPDSNDFLFSFSSLCICYKSFLWITVWLNSILAIVVVKNSLILFLIIGIASISCTLGLFFVSVINNVLTSVFISLEYVLGMGA